MKTTLAALTMSLSMTLAMTGCGEAEVDGVTDPSLDSAAADQQAAATATKVSVGKKIFFDTRLSQPAGQACATCHDPNRAFADGRPGPTSQGAVAGRYGVRNTPGIKYAGYIGGLSAAGDESGYAGGLFWDGRSPDLEDQAGGPLLNPLEMNNPDKASVVNKIKSGPYAAQFKAVFGATVFADVEAAFQHLTEAVAEYERKGIGGRFTSKYDAYLKGWVRLSASEARGLLVFEDAKKGNCASCHLDKPAADGTPPLFTDNGYDNLGVPKNAANPFYSLPAELNPAGAAYVDHGLSAAIHNPRQDGRFKAPTLRNVALTAPYTHNGYFKDLRSVVDFYNTRDAKAWPAPEVAFGMNTTSMGKLGLTDQEVNDLVAFMNTLTDGYF